MVGVEGQVCGRGVARHWWVSWLDLAVLVEVVIVTWGKWHCSLARLLGDTPIGLVAPPEGDALAALGETQMVDLYEVEEQRHRGHSKHKDDEDGFLCGAGYVAVNHIGAGGSVTCVHGFELKAVQKVLGHDEAHLKQRLEDHIEDICPQKLPLQADSSLIVSYQSLLVLHIHNDSLFV